MPLEILFAQIMLKLDPFCNIAQLQFRLSYNLEYKFPLTFSGLNGQL